MTTIFDDETDITGEFEEASDTTEGSEDGETSQGEGDVKKPTRRNQVARKHFKANTTEPIFKTDFSVDP